MMFFPDKYTRPVLQNIVDAAENGWNAICKDGNGPGSGARICNDGGAAGAKGDGFDGVIYTRSNRNNHILDPEDVGEGL